MNFVDQKLVLVGENHWLLKLKPKFKQTSKCHYPGQSEHVKSGLFTFMGSTILEFTVVGPFLTCVFPRGIVILNTFIFIVSFSIKVEEKLFNAN